jgi:hypothetical protein
MILFHLQSNRFTFLFFQGVSIWSQPRVQKFSPVLIEFSAFVELLILRILIKKIFFKSFFFHKDGHKILLAIKRQKRLFSQFWPIVFDNFLHENKVKNEIQDHTLILREKAHLVILNLTWVLKKFELLSVIEDKRHWIHDFSKKPNCSIQRHSVFDRASLGLQLW